MKVTHQSFYALKTIRAHGLNGKALWDVTQVPLVPQLLYASPAWWGYLKVTKGSGYSRSLRRPYGTGIFPDPSAPDELREDSDEKLFFLSRYYHNHVLHRLLPQPKNTGYNLRQRTHDLTLPTDINAVTKQNFVCRMLFRDIY